MQWFKVLYIYGRKIWITKHAMIPIDYDINRLLGTIDFVTTDA
jgi:hypothetical protein